MAARYTRRQFLQRGATASAAGGLMLAGGGTLLAACGSSSASPAESVNLGSMNYQVDWIEDFEYAGAYFADHNGYWRNQGLDVTVLSGGPTVQAELQVATGKALVSLGALNRINDLVLQGRSMKIIAVNNTKSALNIMSLGSKPVRTPQDLIGKTVGVPDYDQSLYVAFLKVNNIKASDIKTVPTTDTATFLASHQGDAAIGFVEEPLILTSKGLDVVVMYMADFGFNNLLEQYVVLASSLQQANSRAQLVAWLRGELMGWKDQFNDPQKGVQLDLSVYGNSLGLDPTVQLEAARAYFAFQRSSIEAQKGFGWFDAQLIAAGAAAIAAAGADSSKIPSIYTTEILSEVYASGGLQPVKVPTS